MQSFLFRPFHRCRLEDAFQVAVDALGGAKEAKPLSVWQKLVASFPEVTIQVVRWHLRQHRMKASLSNGLDEREPMQLEQPTEGALEEVTDVEEEEQQQQQQQPLLQSQLGSADHLQGGLRPQLDPGVCLQAFLPALEHQLGVVMRQKTSIYEVSDEASQILALSLSAHLLTCGIIFAGVPFQQVSMMMMLLDLLLDRSAECRRWRIWRRKYRTLGRRSLCCSGELAESAWMPTLLLPSVAALEVTQVQRSARCRSSSSKPIMVQPTHQGVLLEPS